MAEYERLEDLFHAADGLKELIREHPDLPLMVMAGPDACNDYGYVSCGYVYAELGECLDCYPGFDEERIYTDRNAFEEDLADNMAYDDESGKLPEAEFEANVKEKLAEYEPYWRPCIKVYVNN